nr:DUF3137 domain-containing protein [uncultured Campylobacter sp.]
MNINEAIEATAKKQKECRGIIIKNVVFGFLFIYVVPFVIAFILETIFESDSAILIVLIVYIPVDFVIWTICCEKVMTAWYEYPTFYKNVFVRTAIREVGPNFSYDPFAGISRKEFRRIGIYSPDEFRAEDQISGIYNDVEFSLSEAVDIPNDAKLNLGDSAALNLLSAIVFAWETMKDMQAFSGSVLVCEFYKKFSEQTIVASRTLNTKFIGEKEQMDDTLFNDEFRVFTDNKVEARYLLTPAFMKRLRELKEKFAGEMGVSAAFMDDKFYLFLNGAKNKFETTLFSLPPSLEDAAQIKKEISELLSIIDELNLNLDIFK